MNNVLQIIDFAAPYKGNFISSMENLEAHLSKERQTVYLFPANSKELPWMYDFVAAGHRVYFIDRTFFLKRIKWQNVKALKRIIKTENIHIIHTHFLVYNYTLFLIKTLLIRDIILVGHIHSQYNPPKNKWRRIKTFIMDKTYNLIIGVSPSVAVGLIRNGMPRRKVKSVLNGIDFKRLDEFQELTDKGDKLHKRVLMFGWPFHLKGIDIAISAVSELISEGEKIILEIAYSGDVSGLQFQIVKHFGNSPEWIILSKSREDVATLYNSSDIFLSASREEGFSYALVEAAYCNPLVITSNIPAPVSLGIPGVLFFDTENKDSLKECIRNAMNIPEYEIKIIKVKQRQYVMEAFNLDKWAMDIVKYLNTYK